MSDPERIDEAESEFINAARKFADELWMAGSCEHPPRFCGSSFRVNEGRILFTANFDVTRPWFPASRKLRNDMVAIRGGTDTVPSVEDLNETYEFAKRRNPKECADEHPGDSECRGVDYVYRYKPGHTDPVTGKEETRVFCLCGFTEYREDPGS